MGRKSVKYERTLFFLLLWSFFKVSAQLVCRYPTQFSKLTQIETYHHLKSSTWAGSPQSSLNDSSRSSILVMLSIFIWLCTLLIDGNWVQNLKIQKILTAQWLIFLDSGSYGGFRTAFGLPISFRLREKWWIKKSPKIRKTVTAQYWVDQNGRYFHILCNFW